MLILKNPLVHKLVDLETTLNILEQHFHSDILLLGMKPIAEIQLGGHTITYFIIEEPDSRIICFVHDLESDTWTYAASWDGVDEQEFVNAIQKLPEVVSQDRGSTDESLLNHKAQNPH